MIIKYSEIVEDNGKTIRENNLAKPRRFRLGDIVSLVEDHVEYLDHDGTPAEPLQFVIGRNSTLYVIRVLEDCDGSPLYVLGDKPVGCSSGYLEKESLLHSYMVRTLR